MVLEVGAEGRLVAGSASHVLVAADEKAFDELTEAVVANDTYGLAELTLSGRVVLVPRDTRVLALDLHWTGRTKVRILDGEYAGASGWVASEFVVK
jgi:hypothetical protein